MGSCFTSCLQYNKAYFCHVSFSYLWHCFWQVSGSDLGGFKNYFGFIDFGVILLVFFQMLQTCRNAIPFERDAKPDGFDFGIIVVNFFDFFGAAVWMASLFDFCQIWASKLTPFWRQFVWLLQIWQTNGCRSFMQKSMPGAESLPVL